jgi:hypothetical protein
VQTYSISCSGAGGTANASATVTSTTPTVSITNNFVENAVTISTSEGAPYGDGDIWTRQLDLSHSAYGYGPTKIVRLYICLSGQVAVNQCAQQTAATAPLSDQMLAALEAGIAAYDGTGTRLLIRFVYHMGPPGVETPINLILTHIDQLAPILIKHRDLIFALQAGFLGDWGQWYNNAIATVPPLFGNFSADTEKLLIDKELSHFKGTFPILLPWVDALLTYTGGTTNFADGLGLSDDDYVSGANPPFWARNTGNVSPAQAMTYAAQVAATGVFTGEFDAFYPTGQSCPALDAESYRFHLQSVSMNDITSPMGVGALLQSNGCATTFLSKVGTRIALQQASLIGNSSPGDQLVASLTLVNAGYGRVIRPRPATLVFSSNGNVVGQVAISLQDLDLRNLASASPPVPKTFQFRVTLPSTLPSGRQVSLALLLPDPGPSLTAQPAYALPLNSLDGSGRAIFDATTGYNTIGSFTSGSAR